MRNSKRNRTRSYFKRKKRMRIYPFYRNVTIDDYYWSCGYRDDDFLIKYTSYRTK